MQQQFADFINYLNGFVWHPAMLVFVLGTGLYFTIGLRFTQIRNFKEMFRNLFVSSKSESGISTFASFSTTMAARIGVGNIAGVAVAIYQGGPGAVFWMWMTSLIISATSFVECMLGQTYKVKIDGEYRGGAYYTAEKGLGWKWFGVLFALVSILVLGLFFPGIQSNMISEAVHNATGVPNIVTGLIGGVFVAIVIFGGIRRISDVASIMVPFMAGGFFLLTIITLIMNASRIPEMFGWIFGSAFNGSTIFPGMMGAAIAWGVKRAVYASGAGMGEETPAASAAECDHPVGQGLANSFGIYFDIVVCTCSALLILVTDCFNTASGYIGQGSANMAELAKTGQFGSVFPSEALGTVFPGFGQVAIAVIVFLFAFTTVISYAYQAETSLAYLFQHSHEKLRHNVILLIRAAVVVVYIYFSATTSSAAWALADLGCGMMVWLNVAMITFLFPVARKMLRDYEAQKKAGILNPVFDPDKVGIKNVDTWKEINKDKIAAAKTEQ
jgi:AGCS family alanine or glycine:cation symporter